MKKTMFISIAFVLCLTVSIGVLAQDFKKHNFGIGVQTDIFSGSRAINNFNPPQSFINQEYSHIKVFDVNVKNNSYFGAYFEYQYRINKSFSLSARLGYSYRRVDFRWDVQSYLDNGDLFLGEHPRDKRNAEAVFNNIDIPIYFSYTLPVNEHISWTSSVGFGIAVSAFNAASDSSTAKIFDPDDEILSIDQSLHLWEWEVKPYTLFQTGLDLTIGTHRLRTYIGYKLLLFNDYQWESYGEGASPYEFKYNPILVGLTFFL